MSGLFTVEGGEKWYIYVDGALYMGDGRTYSTSHAGARERAVEVSALVDTDDIVITATLRDRMNIGVMKSIASTFALRAGTVDVGSAGGAADISIDTISLSDGTIGVQYYTEPLQASGGTGTYTWSLVAGSLPAGLSISGSTIQGTPTGPQGTASFTLRCADGTNNPAQKALTILIRVVDPVVVTDTDIPQGYVGVAYSHQFTATGGDGDYVWTETSTNGLPSGITLSSSGLLSGTPTQTWSYWINVWADDEQGNPESTDIYDRPWTVNPAPSGVTIDQTTLTDGIEDAAYSEQLTASGGDGTYVWSQISGTMPTGVSIDAAGLISGTPTNTGDFNFTIQCDDEAITPATQAFTLTIASATNDVAVTTTSLPSGVNGVAYSSQLVATGGDGTYTWSLTAGSWPTGITMSSSGLISGTPTANGSFGVTVQADDGQGNANSTDTQALTLIVSATSVIVHLDWDYADRATMLAATPGGGFFEAAGDAGGLGGVQRPYVLDGSAYYGSAGPWGGTKILENRYPVVPHTGQPQVALNYVFSSAQGPELWTETYMRFDPNWQYDTPPNPTYPGGNIDKKSMFWFEESYAQRWEIKMGPYGYDCIASAGSHDIMYNMMTDPVQAHPQTFPISPDADKLRPADFVGVWKQIRVYLKRSTWDGSTNSSDGEMHVWIDGTKVIQATALNTRSNGRDFRHCTFGGNRNQGTDHIQSEMWGPATFYSSDPGW